MFSTVADIRRCRKIVQDEKLNEIVKDVPNISYSTGGDYLEKSLEAYAAMYLRDNLSTYQ